MIAAARPHGQAASIPGAVIRTITVDSTTAARPAGVPQEVAVWDDGGRVLGLFDPECR